MKILQLGNGGAFNFDQTNTSFLIKAENEDLILFDCGRNVIDKLLSAVVEDKIRLSDLKYVYISHMDDDHDGSLKSLIYYMYFIVGKKLQILMNTAIKDDLIERLKHMDGFYENGRKIHEMLYIGVPVIGAIEIADGLKIKPFTSKHSVPCMGLALMDNTGSVYLTGDTVEVFNDIKACDLPYVIFQDYSSWNCIGKQVHCCTEHFMSEKLRDYFADYNGLGDKIDSMYKHVRTCHTGIVDFNEDWITIEEATKEIDPIMEKLKDLYEEKYGHDKKILTKITAGEK